MVRVEQEQRQLQVAVAHDVTGAREGMSGCRVHRVENVSAVGAGRPHQQIEQSIAEGSARRKRECGTSGCEHEVGHHGSPLRVYGKHLKRARKAVRA